MSRVIHFEIHSDDPEKTVAFYTKVFGWKFQKWDGPMEYWLIMTGAEEAPGINGGLMRRRGAPPADGQAVNAFVCTIDVVNVDESLAKFLAAGGKPALPKMPIPGVGWLAYCKDPAGNLVGMMQADVKAK